MIFLIDLYPKNNFGHFWHQNENFRRAFIQESMEFIFLNPSADMAKIDDEEFSKVNYGKYININVSQNSLEQAIELIENDIKRNNYEKVSLLFSWLPQLNKKALSRIEDLNQQTDITLFGIAPQSPELIYGKDSKFRYSMEEILNESTLRKIIWVWENPQEYISNTGRNYIRKLPEYHSYKPRDKKFKRKIEISFFGMLSPFRGLSEILLIALFNPSTKVVIRGHGFSPLRTWRPFKFKIFRYRNWKSNPVMALINTIVSITISLLIFLPNVKLIKKPFSSNRELNNAISQATTIFYNAKLPISSGISLTALASGVPVIWIGSSGEAFDFLYRNCQPGRINFIDIFKLNFIKNKIVSLQYFEPKEVYSWHEFVNEVRILKNFC